MGLLKAWTGWTGPIEEKSETMTKWGETHIPEPIQKLTYSCNSCGEKYDNAWKAEACPCVLFEHGDESC